MGNTSIQLFLNVITPEAQYAPTCGGQHDLFNALFPKLLKAYRANERITIEIVDNKPAPLAAKAK